MSRIIKTSALALTAATIIAGAANAGGFNRGSANIGILLDEGHGSSFNLIYVDPTRPNENGIDTAGSFVTIDGAVAAQFGDAKCGLTYAQPYGLNSDETGTALSPFDAKTDTASSHELGATCAYGFDAGPVRAFVLGGVFYQTLNYEREYFLGANTPVLDLGDSSFGYRIGVGVAKPEIALKASLVYRSEVDHDLDGTLSLFPAFNAIPGSTSATTDPTAPGFVPRFNFSQGVATAQITTPQSVKLSLQTGVAPRWLVFGSVEWTDWSILQVTPVFVDGQPAASLNSGFRDGWTVSGGAGHQINEKLSVAASITWDRGVSDGFAAAGGQKISPSFGSMTYGVGVNYSANDKVSLRGGLGYTYLNGGTFFDLDDKVAKTYDSGHAIAGSLNLSVKF